jgi:hypothetical protein
MIQKFGYNWFPPMAHYWGIKHFVPDKTPPLFVEEEGPPTLKELNTGVTHVNTYPTSINMGGQDFTTCQLSPPHLPGSGHTRAPGCHAWGGGGIQHRTSTNGDEYSGSGGI